MTLVFVGGYRYVTGLGPVPGGVAVRSDRILAVGTDDEVLAAAGRGARVFDLQGGLVSPAFGDSHLHPMMGGLELGQCNLDDCRNGAECLEAIASFAASRPDETWIVGGGWSMDWFPGGTPGREELDRIVSDRPVFLRSRDHHSAWANTRALSLAGIDALAMDPADGRVERDDRGLPQGTLHEGAAHLVMEVMPSPTETELLEGLIRGQDHCLSLGVAHWHDALLRRFESGIDALDVYLEAALSGALKARVTGALWWDRNRGVDQIDDLLRRRERATAHRSHLRVDAVKIMVDGIAENYTASLSRPYRDACGHATENFGMSFLGKDALCDATVVADMHGFQTHFHALGDQAVTDALDAVQRAREVNGDTGLRHTLAHLQIVVPPDWTRFSGLSAIANIQPLWACNEPQMTELTLPFLDPHLAGWQYPFKSLLEAGAVLAAGSDWPVSSANPLEGMQVAVSRVSSEFPDAPPFLPAQTLDLVTIWDAYTSGVAYLNSREYELGRLEPGHLADVVVLDRNPFARPTDEISAAEVWATFVGGEAVYQSDAYSL